MHRVRRPLGAGGAVAIALLAIQTWIAPAPAPAAAPAVPAATKPSQVSFVNTIPDTTVDLWVGITPLLLKVASGVAYGDTSPAFPLEGTRDAVVVTAGGDPTVPDDVVLAQTILMPTDDTVSLVANVIGGSPNLRNFIENVYPDANVVITARFRNVADAPPLDVYIDGKLEVSGLGAGSGEVAKNLLAGLGHPPYTVTVTLGDGTLVPAFSQVITPKSGVNPNLYFSGSLTDPATYPPGVVTQQLDVGTNSAEATPPTTGAGAAPTTTVAAPAAAALTSPRFTG